MSNEVLPAEKRPRRVVAILLALLTACGTGHYYAGLRSRAIRWLVGLSAGMVLLSLAVVVLGPRIGFSVPFAAGLVFIFVAWLGPALDLALFGRARWKRVPAWHVFVFWLGSTLVTVTLSYGLRAAFIEVFRIPSGAMAPALHVGDHFFVDKFSYGVLEPFSGFRLVSTLPPTRGDIIVFRYPDPNPAAARQDFVKRVIAIEGDTLEVHDGRPIINGWRVPTCPVGTYELDAGNGPRRGDLEVEFLDGHAYLTWFEDGLSLGREGPYRVAPGEAWVLGDNRNNSSDSRAWNQQRGAGVPHADIKGRALCTWLAFDADRRVLWDRIGTDLNDVPELPRDATPELVARFKDCLAQRPANTVPPKPRAVF